MTAYPAWTPAPQPGIVPLHPLSFGTILGRSFAALRQNPKVLLGFAIGVQTGAYLLVIMGVVAVAWASFARLDTVRYGSPDFDAIMAGSVALTAIAALVLGLAAGALGVIVQGVVVSEVAHAVVAEKLTLALLWQRVKPVAWRLIGYAFLLSLAVLLVIAVVVAGIVALWFAALPVAIALSVLLVLAAIPLWLWLSTKLLLVPAAIILEQATIGGAVVRSWTLIRGRFWAALGIVVIISVVFSAVGQVVGIPFSFLSTALSTVIAPTGASDPTGIIALVVGGLLTQIVTLLVQSVAVIVQSTATALIYVDCRMRREGLDLDLLAYVERRDAGATALSDPYLENVGRAIAPRPPASLPPVRPGAYPPPAYVNPPQPAYPPPGYSQPSHAQPAHPQAYPPTPAYVSPAPSSAPPPAGTPAPAGPTRVPTAPPQAPAAPAPGTQDPPAAPDPTRWAAPGGTGEADDPADPESPWS
jgi:MFS family permease